MGQVIEADWLVQVVSVSLIALLATVGVYGVVALLVRMDDAGLALMKREVAWARSFGSFLVEALPWTIKGLTAVGTVALLLVSGGIFHHHIPRMHEFLHSWPSILADGFLGIVGGTVVWFMSIAIKNFKGRVEYELADENALTIQTEFWIVAMKSAKLVFALLSFGLG